MLIPWRNLGPEWKSKLICGTSLGIGGILYLKVLMPHFKIGIPCVFHELTGLYCPGCGITRTIVALLDFNLYQAFRYNMLIFAIIPLYIGYVWMKYKGNGKYGNAIMWMMVVMALLFGVLRNVPMFNWLAPITVP
jgi:hypothetical protein